MNPYSWGAKVTLSGRCLQVCTRVYVKLLLGVKPQECMVSREEQGTIGAEMGYLVNVDRWLPKGEKGPPESWKKEDGPGSEIRANRGNRVCTGMEIRPSDIPLMLICTIIYIFQLHLRSPQLNCCCKIHALYLFMTIILARRRRKWEVISWCSDLIFHWLSWPLLCWHLQPFPTSGSGNTTWHC